ncbi:MAG: hypothetical protein IPG32_17470 [Saprospirales bacterium]|nr:hypothetical protein [Saprospirales bacterium]
MDDKKWQKIVKILSMNRWGCKPEPQRQRPGNIHPAPSIGASSNSISTTTLSIPFPRDCTTGQRRHPQLLPSDRRTGGHRTAYEAKLLIVGEPGAGKTTLLTKLIEPAYLPAPKGDLDITSTVGINIHEGWSFPSSEGSVHHV